MKPTLLKLATFLLMVAVAIASCEKPVEPTKPNPPKPPQEPDPPPTSIPIELYSFGTHCYWLLEKQYWSFTGVFCVKSEEELYATNQCYYTFCVDGGRHPEIDFSKQTLLLVRGGYSYPISDISKISLQPWEETEHFELTIELSALKKESIEGAYPWQLAFLTDKLCDTCHVKLNAIYSYDYSEPKYLELTSGLYVETSPHPIGMDCIKINVLDHETLTFNNGNERRYVIDGYTIKFENNPREYYFRIIDENKFEIENLHGGITFGPIYPNTVFERVGR